MGEYKCRIADKVLERKLKSSGVVVVEGAKWCGKTTTAEQIAGSVVYMNDPKKKKTCRRNGKKTGRGNTQKETGYNGTTINRSKPGNNGFIHQQFIYKCR